MKKLNIIKKLSFSTMIILMESSRCVSAITESSDDGSSKKYIFIGVAVIVVLMLLFFGYKIDTKENTVHKINKSRINQKNNKRDIPYEKDNISYESDNISPIKTDITEYEEDSDDLDDIYKDENELYNDVNFFDNKIESADPLENDETTDIDLLSKKIDDLQSENDEVAKNNDDNKEFDMSIIDNIEEDEEPVNDSTMVFDNSTLMKEIDELEDDDSFANSLKNFKEPENDFKDFSSASNPKSKVKKYTRIKKRNIETNDKDAKVKKEKKSSTKKKKE